MFKKLYDKSKLAFALMWIALYCISMSVGDALSSAIGLEKSVSMVIGLMLSALLLFFLKKNRLCHAYGLCKPRVSARAMIYYIPVIIMLTANLWFGAGINRTPLETVLYILTMFTVGFLEEVIFRGLLFGAMRKDNLKAAIIVSSITFGIGHIINLFNGSGAELVPNLLQVVYATAAGFMFVMIYCRTDSLIVCIAAHGLFNATSIFSSEAAQTPMAQIISCILLTVITGIYAIYIAAAVKYKANRDSTTDT